MPRYCFVSHVSPEQIPTYRERHRTVWPEMLAALRDAGWRNYSLYLSDDGLLVGVFEADDQVAAQAAMDATDVNARWQAEMSRLFASDGKPNDEFTYLPEVFNLADQLTANGLPVEPAAAQG